MQSAADVPKAASARQAALDTRIRAVQKQVDDRAAAREKWYGGRGSELWALSESEQRIENRLQAELKALKDGRFLAPGHSQKQVHCPVPAVFRSAQAMPSSGEVFLVHIQT